MANNKPSLVNIKISSDKRGSVYSSNEFTFRKIKRFYVVENSKSEKIRAFHGHFREEKFALVISGKVLLCVLQIDDKTNPQKNVKPYRFVLDENDPKIVHIPGGFANGFKVLKNGSKIMFFSTSTLSKSLKDDFRFPYDYWGKELWDTNGL